MTNTQVLYLHDESLNYDEVTKKLDEVKIPYKMSDSSLYIKVENPTEEQSQVLRQLSSPISEMERRLRRLENNFLSPWFSYYPLLPFIRPTRWLLNEPPSQRRALPEKEESPYGEELKKLQEDSKSHQEVTISSDLARYLLRNELKGVDRR